MKPTPSRLALRVFGVLILAFAGVRLAMDIFRTFKVSEPDSTTGLILGVGIDLTTLTLAALGALFCALGFRAQKNRT